MQSNMLNFTDTDTLDKKYIDPETAKIIIEQIAKLKHRTAVAEEQLEMLIKEKCDKA